MAKEKSSTIKKRNILSEITLSTTTQLKNKYNFIDSENNVLVKDKETGTLIESLEKSIIFEFLDGILVPIKKKDLSSWKKEKENATRLKREQKQTLKAFIDSVLTKRPLTKEEIKIFIAEIHRPSRPEKIRQSAHFANSKIESGPVKIDALELKTKKKILESSTKVKTYNLDFTPQEDKAMTAINNLLYKNSENRNEESPHFYLGNEIAEQPLSKYKQAMLRIKPIDYVKEYLEV